MTRWTHAVCDECWLEKEPYTEPVRLREPRFDYCGFCARRTESGIYTRCDPAEVPFPDRPADARCYIAAFRRLSLPPGATYVQTSHRRILLDRMTDADAVFVAGEFRRMKAEAMARRASRPPPPRGLGLT
jgi:hypothetical protein